MSIKTLFIIVLTILVTVILMKNTDEVTFWIFGEVSIPKLAILGTMFGLGLIIGFLAGRPRKDTVHYPAEDYQQTPEEKTSRLSDEDRDYIN